MTLKLKRIMLNVDEHKYYNNAKMMMERLAYYSNEEAEHDSILMFAFSSLDDKAHKIEQSGSGKNSGRNLSKGVLTGLFSGTVSVTPDKITNAKRSAQKKIFAIRSKSMGPIYAIRLMSQLLANGIVKLGVADSKVGKTKTNEKLTVRVGVELKLPTITHESILQPALVVLHA